MAPDDPPDRFLGWRQVRELTGLGRTTAWRMRLAGDFPDPVPISPRRVAWRLRDIIAWNESRGAVIPVQPQRGRPRTPRPLSREAAPVTPLPEPPPPRLPVPGTPAPRITAPWPTASKSAAVRPRAPRRARPQIADGQLGFDF